MIYVVHGSRVQILSVEVEAETEREALIKASNGDWITHGPDVWDSEYEFTGAHQSE